MGKVLSYLERRRYPLLFLVLLGSAIVMLASHRSRGAKTPLLARVFLEISGPFEKAITKALGEIRELWNRYIYIVHLEEENRLLREIIEELRQERVQLMEYREENKRLRSLLEFKERFQRPLLPAQVIGKDLSGWFQTLLIDRGTRDGVAEGMAVVCVQGVVGQVMETSRSFARVLLITDPNSAVAALTQRTRAPGIVEGRGLLPCRLKYLRRSEDVRPGDLVLTSGLDGVYPKGVLIGKVIRAETRDPELFQRVEIEPSVELGRLEEVMVICERRLPGKAEQP